MPATHTMTSAGMQSQPPERRFPRDQGQECQRQTNQPQDCEPEVWEMQMNKLQKNSWKMPLRHDLKKPAEYVPPWKLLLSQLAQRATSCSWFLPTEQEGGQIRSNECEGLIVRVRPKRQIRLTGPHLTSLPACEACDYPMRRVSAGSSASCIYAGGTQAATE